MILTTRLSPCTRVNATQTGTLSQKYGAKECNLTSPGYFWVNGTTERPCASGNYASEGDGVCTPCEAGSYAPSIATSNCTLCVAGKHLGATGSATGCSLCPAGTHASRLGAALCDECSNGTYSTGPLTPGPSAAPSIAPTKAPTPPSQTPSMLPTVNDTDGGRRLSADESASHSLDRRLDGDSAYSFSFDYEGVDDDYMRWFLTWGSPWLNGTVECTPCPAGTAQAAWGQTGCESCS